MQTTSPTPSDSFPRACMGEVLQDGERDTNKGMNIMNTELAIKQPSAVENMRQATDVAGVSKEIVMKTACNIKGKKYVKVEGWQAIAVAHGCILSAKDVERTETGIKAIGEVRRIENGAVIATAEGFVGNDEATWGSREEYARRAMAQTRAMSRAARSAFAHVVVMIDSNLSTTPAEEIPEEGFTQVVEHKPKVSPKFEDPHVKSVDDPTAQIIPMEVDSSWQEAVVPYGKNKGKTLFELKPFSIMYYYQNYKANEKYPDSTEFRKAIDIWFAQKGHKFVTEYNAYQTKDSSKESEAISKAQSLVSANKANDLAEDDIPF